MKIINYMNFVRLYDPRLNDDEKSKVLLFNTAKDELALARKYKIDSTFLLQYDALCAKEYIELFKKEQGEHTELGLWFEVVRPLAEKVGLSWRGNPDWTWDWKVIPGFLMAYTIEERKLLIDEAMNKFKEIYGNYPKTVASWLIDSFSANYLSEKYDIDALAICRDQLHIDAYTLVGGYFNQGYYPSKNNIFAPSQCEETRVKTPVFRLLGPDPIHNYDAGKYIKNMDVPPSFLITLEPCSEARNIEGINEWYAKTYFENEDLGFSYAQIGQENSFGMVYDVITPLEKQLEFFTKHKDVEFWTMKKTGGWFKETYPDTPATCVSATEDWDRGDEVQSVIYDCKRYTANIFRCEDKVFIRNMYLFDEKNTDRYLEIPCDNWEATYENLPIADTLLWEGNKGIVLDTKGEKFEVEKSGDEKLRIFWKDKYVEFSPDGICLSNIEPEFDFTGATARIKEEKDKIEYVYNDISYAVKIERGKKIKLSFES